MGPNYIIFFFTEILGLLRSYLLDSFIAVNVLTLQSKLSRTKKTVIVDDVIVNSVMWAEGVGKG